MTLKRRHSDIVGRQNSKTTSNLPQRHSNVSCTSWEIMRKIQ